MRTPLGAVISSLLEGAATDFERLQAINKDAAAWIDFPGQGISYPVEAGDAVYLCGKGL